MTSLQPEESAQAPWTSTTVGFGPLGDADAAVDAVSTNSASRASTLASVASNHDLCVARRAMRMASIDLPLLLG